MLYFQNPVHSLIKKRTSCRTFSPTAVDPQIRVEIEKFLAMCSNETFRFSIIEKPTGPEAKRLGTYGTIVNGNLFIAGIVKKNADLFEFGAVLETILLFCTDRGLSGCWIGGSFDRKGFSSHLKVSTGEFVPVIIPIGYPAQKKSILERAMRFFAGANHRKEWEKLFFAGSFSHPLSNSIAGDYIQALEAVRLAPSAMNRQPWRVLADGEGYHFYLNRNKGFGKFGYDMQRIDMGIAFAHFALVAKELYCRGTIVENCPMTSPGYEYVKSWIISR
jgi:hypothetical protein